MSTQFIVERKRFFRFDPPRGSIFHHLDAAVESNSCRTAATVYFLDGKRKGKQALSIPASATGWFQDSSGDIDTVSTGNHACYEITKEKGATLEIDVHVQFNWPGESELAHIEQAGHIRHLQEKIEQTEAENKHLKEQAAKRNRKSSPEIIARNVEICDRRKQDKKHWSIGRLARAYKVSHRAITLVLQEENKWRRLAQENAQ
jgi:hypothetical protein